MARKRVTFLCTLGFLKLWHWVKYLIYHHLLVWFLLGIFFSFSILPALSQITIANSTAQPYFQQAAEFYQAEDFSQAAEYLERAAEMFRMEKKWEELAKTLTNLGRSRLILGQPQAALNIWAEAAQLYHELNQPEDVLNTQIYQIEALQALGRHQDAGTKIEYLENFLSSEFLDPSTKVRGLRVIGEVMRSSGNLEESEKKLKESLKIAERLQVNQEINQEISRTLASLGNTFSAKARRIRILQDDPTTKYDYFPWRCGQKSLPEEALEQYRQAINEYQEAIAKSPSQQTKTQIQLNELKLQVEIGQLDAERPLWSEVDLSQFSETSRPEVYAHIKLAKSLACLKAEYHEQASDNIPSWEDIETLVKKAVKDAQSLEDDQRTQSYALGDLAGLYEYWGWLWEKEQQTEQAKKYRKKSRGLTRRALNLAQSINASDITYQWQWQLARLWRAEGNRQKALESYELTAEAIDNFRQNTGAIAFNLRELNSDQNFYFRQNVEPAYRQLIELLLEPTPGKTQPSPAAIEKARRYFQKFQAAEIESLFICSLQGDKNRSSIDKFIEDKQLNAAAIYPIVLRDKIGVIINLPNAAEPLYYVSSERSNLLDYIDKQVIVLQDSAQPMSKVEESAQNLYQLLISPAQKKLASYFADSAEKILVFIPDSPLTSIPLAALHDGREFLIEKYAVVLSTGWLLKDSNPFEEVKLDSLIVAVEDPKSRKFDQLTSVGKEVKNIKDFLNKPRVFFDKEEIFTKQELEDDIDQSTYNLIHLATHGQFSSDLRNTLIIAAPGEEIEVNDLDGLLLSENRRNSQTLDLLVFSACQTASDDKRAALGIAGAAVKVGASSTLATLWSVDDRFTAEFMGRFYQELIEGNRSRVEALRITQKYFLDDRGVPGDGRMPFEWAPYTLVGDWR
ncbi:MAG: CHAT domain-containing protein [Symploca sp. SIO2G7]|nr:CHAT domain-containing protein [Symploca sp. SIO2G7]